ncbi:MAG TPA: prepilin-type N-terminal cleavage/methylation domain-containing protein [Pyrinomonadaceae bacterium]|nr:prepilin-type N-terminal cleavage/methylation domain-containing protein [Pyrinomonadaceae bacterium]
MLRKEDKHKSEAGFSLLEMVVSTTLMLLVASAALSALYYSQQVYVSQQLKSEMHEGLRSSFELLTQEIGQAGSLNFAPRTLTASVTGSTSAQTVSVSSSANIFVGEQLTVGLGSAQEVVQVTSLPQTNRVTGIFRRNHANGETVLALGVFPQGVLSTSNATSLQLVGDVNADGSLAYVRYDCDTAAGTLTRSLTTINPGVTVQNPAEILLNDLVANPDGTPCFQYGSAVTIGGNTFIPNIAVSLTVRTTKTDPQTKAYSVMTKSFSNLASRNVLAGITLANASPSATYRLQPTPPALPLAIP